MSRETLIDTVENSFSSKAEAGRAIDAIVKGIETVVRGGDRVYLRGFGTFQAQDRAARVARNPRTGESINVGAKRKLVFKSKVEL